MRFSQPKREEISLGVSIAPLIDIVFLLLIFFMLTSHYISERGSDQSADTLTVALDKTGNCYLQKIKISLKDLYLSLKERTKEKKINLILNADRDVKHGHVVRIMDLAKKAGINSIVIAAQWREEKVL
jgi:biopolymer transport protein ExbD